MTNSAVEEWFASSPPDQRVALERLRGLVRAVAGESSEEIKWGRPCYSSQSRLFCYLHRSTAHVTIGFQRGGDFEDPDGLLEGTGKAMRHITLKGADDVDRKASGITALLQQAVRP